MDGGCRGRRRRGGTPAGWLDGVPPDIGIASPGEAPRRARSGRPRPPLGRWGGWPPPRLAQHARFSTLATPILSGLCRDHRSRNGRSCGGPVGRERSNGLPGGGGGHGGLRVAPGAGGGPAAAAASQGERDQTSPDPGPPLLPPLLVLPRLPSGRPPRLHPAVAPLVPAGALRCHLTFPAWGLGAARRLTRGFVGGAARGPLPAFDTDERRATACAGHHPEGEREEPERTGVQEGAQPFPLPTAWRPRRPPRLDANPLAPALFPPRSWPPPPSNIHADPRYGAPRVFWNARLRSTIISGCKMRGPSGRSTTRPVGALVSAPSPWRLSRTSCCSSSGAGRAWWG